RKEVPSNTAAAAQQKLLQPQIQLEEQPEAVSSRSSQKRKAAPMPTPPSHSKWKLAKTTQSAIQSSPSSQVGSKALEESIQHAQSASQLPSSAEYKARKESRKNVDLINKMAEVASAQRSAEARVNMLSKSTVSQYLRYERHWAAWCERRGYGNIYVELVRARRYLEELTAEHPDPENGIEPLRVRIKNKSGAPVRYGPPSLETVDMYIKSLVNLYQTQCADPAIP
ncbi:hypothetical protein BGX26_008089, partial [Mortierella sp. AD094]